MRQVTRLPTHIAIVPDGNRRWAKLHKVPRFEGHRAGANNMHRVVDYLIGKEIKYLTVWGFSTDNWKRTSEELEDLFNLLKEWIQSDTPWLHSRGIILRHLGRLQELPQGLQHALTSVVALTRNNTGMTLNLAFNYGGRSEIIDAVRRLIDDRVPSHLVDEAVITNYLYTDGMPDVDLLIRTAGESRISNFLLWQTAYSEYYFTDVLWPNFGAEELERALSAYSERHRRLGGD